MTDGVSHAMTDGDDARTWKCLLCGVRVDGHRQQADHMRNYGYDADDPRRCDNVIRQTIPAVITNPGDNVIWQTIPAVITNPVENNSPDNDVDDGDFSFASDHRCIKLLTRRRRADDPSASKYYKEVLVARPLPVMTMKEEPIDMTVLQVAWDQYLKDIKGLGSSSFWKFFLDLHDQPQVAIDAALQAARSTFLSKSSKDERYKFIPSKRELLRRMQKITPQFWPRVTHSINLDLTKFNINKKILFRFVDPIWAWIMSARRLLSIQNLEWQAKVQIDRHTGERLYGGGVEFGDAFQTACLSCPVGTYPMCVSLHFDGAHARGMWSTPIGIGVANVNSQSAIGHTCIGYLPKPDLGAHFSTTSLSRQVKHYIRQQCISAILGVLEHGASRGVRCILCIDGTKRVRTLFPRLMSMNLDQPEAQAYFGMKNARSCSKCRYIVTLSTLICLQWGIIYIF